MYLKSVRISTSDIFLNIFSSFKIFDQIIGSYRTFVSVFVKGYFVQKKNIIKNMLLSWSVSKKPNRHSAE